MLAVGADRGLVCCLEPDFRLCGAAEIDRAVIRDITNIGGLGPAKLRRRRQLKHFEWKVPL
ncbi:hypothetical protein B1987_25050 [Mycobacterium kansasii]|nr:hypothetical protein B1987_25050 [Mycobacterium kansasii]